MAFRLIRLRFLQIYRGSGNIGIFRVLFLAVVLLPLLFLFLFQRIALHPWSFVIPAAVLYIIWLVHSRRKDFHFLLAITRRPYRIFIAEYFIFTLPVVLLLLSAALFFHTLVFIVFIIVIALTVPSKVMNGTRTAGLGVIPQGMFEWQGGIRKNLVVIVVFYIPGIFGFYQVWLSALSLITLTMVFVSFYSEYEPLNMLSACESGSQRFLARKVARHTGFFALFILPLFLISLIHNEFRWISLGYFLASLNLMAFSILLKYYQYRPAAFSGAHQMLVTLAVFISVILPVALFLLLFNFFLAEGAGRNLKPYLDDFN